MRLSFLSLSHSHTRNTQKQEEDENLLSSVFAEGKLKLSSSSRGTLNA